MKLSIVVVSYNTKEHLRNALCSIQDIVLKQYPKRDIETFVVDNGSKDGSVEMMKTEFPWADLIEMNENVGYAKANNQALKRCRGEYVMLFNSDAEFTTEGSIRTLLEFLDEHQNVGVVTPKVLLDSGRLDWACHRGFPTPWNAFAYFTKSSKVIPIKFFLGYHLEWKDLSTEHEVDAVSGAAMIVRSEAIEKVGLLDERFFMYAEDIDWCYRFKRAGYRIVYHPGLVVHHHKYQSGKKHATNQTTRKKTSAMFYDTMIQFYEKHYTKRYPAFIHMLVKIGIVIIKKVKGV